MPPIRLSRPGYAIEQIAVEHGAHGLRVIWTQVLAVAADPVLPTDDASTPMPKLLKTLLVSAATAGAAALAWRAASGRLLGPRHSHAALPEKTSSSQEVEAEKLSEEERRLLLEELKSQF